MQYGYNWAYFSFASNVCFFAFGMYAFRVAQRVDAASLIMRWLAPVFSLVLLSALMLAEPASLLRAWKNEPIVWGVGFSVLCLWQSTHPSRWSANRVFEFVGERSYSVYLLHPIVIVLFKNPIQETYAEFSPQIGAYAFFVCALLVLVPLLLLAEATYRLIEVPGIAFGKRINRQIRERARTTHPHMLDGSEEIGKY